MKRSRIERGVRLPRVRSLRVARLMTQQELADRADVSLFTVSRVEHGGVASYATVKALAVALDVPPEQLWQA